MVPDYARPGGISQVMDLLGNYGSSARLVAGGTDLLIKVKRKAIKPAVLIDLTCVQGLDVFDVDAGDIVVGAAVTHNAVACRMEPLPEYAALGEASRQVGSYQIRNLATVAGNICNASPSAETSPSLLVLNARAVVVSNQGRREVPMEGFFRGPGVSCLESSEFVTKLIIPQAAPYSGSAYLKLSPRRQMDLAIVGVAAAVTLDETGEKCQECRIALGAVAPTPVRVPSAEAAVKGTALSPEVFAEAGRLAATSEECRPIDDLRASKEYRREMVAVMTRRALQKAWERARGEQA